MSYKVENTGKRGFISKPSDFEKGGELTAEGKHKVLEPGKQATVVDSYGEILATYKDIRVLSRPKKA